MTEVTRPELNKLFAAAGAMFDVGYSRRTRRRMRGYVYFVERGGTRSVTG
jgi:hypothetical protein